MAGTIPGVLASLSSCNRAPSSCTIVHPDHINIPIRASCCFALCGASNCTQLVHTCHHLVPVRPRCNTHTQPEHIQSRAEFPASSTQVCRLVIALDLAHASTARSPCHLSQHFHDTSQLAGRQHGTAGAPTQVLAHFAGPGHCSSSSMAPASDCCGSGCCSPIRSACAMWVHARASSG